MKRLEDLHPHVLGHITTIEATYQVARMAIELGVPGDFVECGVYAGAQSAAMARAIMDKYWELETPGVDTTSDDAVKYLKGTREYYKDTRRVHLFDSFQGFPELSREHDGDLIVTGHKAGDSAVSLEDVQRNMKRWGIPDELLVYHPGWFSETMRPTVLTDIDRIAVLRLDADLYESTRDAMRHLYHLVSPGGWVIVDDWNLDGVREAIDEYNGRFVPAPIMWRKDA